jgi:phospholipase C
MDRREFLKVAGLSAVSAAIGPKIVPASAAGRVKAVGPLASYTDNIPEIRHVVTLMMENHSFDNILGALVRPSGPQVDGLTFSGGVAQNSNPDADGNPVTAYHMPDLCQDGYNVSQSWDASHLQCNSGAMDGFVKTSGTASMGYWTEDDLPVTYALAKQFPVIDRWFASTMCQTFPNRMFLWAGSAQGSVSTNVQERAQAMGPNKPFTSVNTGLPRLGGTIFDQLLAKGIPWKNYFVDLADDMLWGPDYFPTVAPYTRSIAEFFVDAATGTLPAFSHITMESFEVSEENPQSMANGEAFVWSIVQTILASPAWPVTALIITYDEHGGYYDHVRPIVLPSPGDGIDPKTPNLYGDHYTVSGFRVPAIVVSPWARANYVASARVNQPVFDHTSILAFLEAKFDLQPMTDRDAAANNMIDVFDFSHRTFATPPGIPVPPFAQQTLQCLQDGRKPVANPA